MRFAPISILVAGLFVAAGGAAAAEPGSTPDAVVVRLTEADLNRILRGAFHASGGPVYSGQRANVSRAVHGMRYELRLSEPVLALGAGASASLRVDILEADVTIERIERKILGQRARCEGAGLLVEPGHPLALAVDIDFVAQAGDVQLVPVGAASPGAGDAVRLVKPVRCSNTVLPTWLLWGLGKPRLRRQVDRIDRVLLERARDAADDLAAEGLVREQWEVGATTFRLEARRVETDHAVLTVAFDALHDQAEASVGPVLPPPAPVEGESSVAISERLVNAAIGAAFDAMTAHVRRPAGDFRRLIRSEAVFALVPGLRELDPKTRLLFQIRVLSPPRVRFGELAPQDARPAPSVERAPKPEGERAVVEIEAKDIALDVLRETPGEPALLGTLTIESGRVRAVPYINRLGGIAFEPIDNTWRVTSSGIDFDEPLLAATIQELVFGALFETRFEPIAPGGWVVGDERIAPRAFRAGAGYLVVSLGDGAEPPVATADAYATRTDSLRASR